MSEQAQPGDTVRLTITTEGVVEKWLSGKLNVNGHPIDTPNRTVEILARATRAPLPSESSDRELLMAAASWWGWCTDNDHVLPDLAILGDVLLRVKHQMAMTPNRVTIGHQIDSEPLSAQSGTDTRSDTLGPQMGTRGGTS